MCGICGWVDYTENLLKYKEIYHELLRTLVHRGPDENGIYEEEHAIFLHARLSVMDLKNGHQPMYFKNYVMVYNGELYNCKELKAVLQNVGYTFHSNCDSEVLIKAYDYYKEECLQKINGIYAFAIWDTQNKTLFMARDRLGVKPFFYCFVEDGILFASEIKTLLQHPKVDAIIDEDGLKELFLLGPARTRGKTPLKGIYELEAGECAMKTKEIFQKTIYWKLESKKHPHTLEETIEHFRKLVEDAIVSQLDSDVGICTFLSGGMDSSIISKIASMYYTDLDTFSIEYEENDKYFRKSVFQPNRDEDFIQIMVDACHSHHHSMLYTQNEVFNALKEATYSRDLPGMAEVDSSLLLFCKDIKKYHSVALSGEGADEILGGYPWYSNELILWKDVFPWNPSIDVRLFCLKDNILHNPEKYMQEAYQNTIQDVTYLKEDSVKDKRMREMFYLNIRWFLQTLLDRKDRMSMHSALEVRVPFLDYRIVEYAYNMPWEYKALHGREKGILREAFKNLLPKEIIERKKSPYPKSHHPQYTHMLIHEIRSILDTNCLLSTILDIKKVEEFIENIDSISIPWYGQLMKGPQILAYFIQMHYFFEKYKVRLELKTV